MDEIKENIVPRQLIVIPKEVLKMVLKSARNTETSNLKLITVSRQFVFCS